MSTLRLPILAALVAVAGCLDVAPPPISTPAKLRIVNAAPATTNVTARLDQFSGSIIEPMAFKGWTQSCLLLDAGQHEITFLQSGNTLGRVSSTFEAGGRYTMVLTNSGSTYRSAIFTDNQPVGFGNTALRFINVSSGPGDVYVSPPDEEPREATKAIGNLAVFPLTTGLPSVVERPAADVRVRFFDVGSTTSARSDFTLSGLPPGRLVTVVLTTPASEEDPGAFQVNPCG